MMIMRFPRLRTVERHVDQAPRIEARQEGCNQAEPESYLTEHDLGLASGESAFQDGVLGEEASETDLGVRNTEADNGNRPDHHGRIGERHEFGEPAHATHILLMVHAMDNRASAKEQKRLEEGVREEVEHGRFIGADTRHEEHVAKLGTGRIGDHALDIVLRHTNRGRIERGHRTHDGDHACGVECVLIDRRQEADEIDACGHHGGGVDQGRYRGRTFHRIRQPDMQEELGRLAHSANEEQHADNFQRIQIPIQERNHQVPDRGRIREANGHNGRIVAHGVQYRTELD